MTAGRDALPKLTSAVDGGVLVLGSKPGFDSTGSIRYRLTLPALQGLDVNGSGNVRGRVVATGPFAVRGSGSGETDLTGLTASNLVVRISGSGGIHLSGRASAQRVTISGSGTYDGNDLPTRQADVRLSGSGDAHVSVSRRLSADVTGSGDIIYSGSPLKVQSHTSGSGAVHAG